MSLDQVVSRIITGDGRPPFFAAICLYEFQVALLYPKSFEKLLEAPELSERGPTKILRRARIYAAIRILEHLADEAKREGKSIGIQKASQADHYNRLFHEIILENGGWKQIRYMLSVRDFELDLAQRTSLAKTAAKCVDFSFRFETIPDPGRHLGGIRSARWVMARSKWYGVDRKIGTVKNRWRKFKGTSAFLYLSFVKNLLPRPKLTKKSFVETLLKATEDKDQLRRFFLSYQQLYAALHPRKYAFPALKLDLGNDKPLSIEPFDPDVLRTWAEIKTLPD